MNKLLTVSKWFVVSTCASMCIWLVGIEIAAATGHRSESRIKGVWSVRVDITNCIDNKPGSVVFASFDAMNIFAADGTFLDANAQSPVMQSAHFGYWRHVRG